MLSSVYIRGHLAPAWKQEAILENGHTYCCWRLSLVGVRFMATRLLQHLDALPIGLASVLD